MEILISLIFFIVGTVTFTKKIKIHAIVCTFLFYLAINNIKNTLFLQLTYIAIIVIAYAYLLMRKKLKGEIVYFSIPCWLLIASILINVFTK